MIRKKNRKLRTRRETASTKGATTGVKVDYFQKACDRIEIRIADHKGSPKRFKREVAEELKKIWAALNTLAPLV